MPSIIRRLEKPGTLVSRTDSQQLHPGYVVLEPGKDVGEHTTENGEELIMMFEGKGEVVFNGRMEVVKAPCVVLVPAHTVHNVWNTSETLLKYVYVVVASDESADN